MINMSAQKPLFLQFFWVQFFASNHMSSQGIYLRLLPWHYNDKQYQTMSCTAIVLFRDSLLPHPENGPGTQAGKERVLHYLQAHTRNEQIILH